MGWVRNITVKALLIVLLRSLEILLELSLSQFLGGRKSASIETTKKLLATKPGFSPARLLLAFALYLNGRLEEAETIAGEGLHQQDASAYLYYLHAAILLKLQNHNYHQILSELATAKRKIPDCSLCRLAASK